MRPTILASTIPISGGLPCPSRGAGDQQAADRGGRRCFEPGIAEIETLMHGLYFAT